MSNDCHENEEEMSSLSLKNTTIDYFLLLEYCCRSISIYFHYIAMYCIVLYCSVLCCVVLCCVVLCCVVLCRVVLHCIALHCIGLHCIMRPYTEGRLDRYCIGIPQELSEISPQPWLGEGSLTCDPCHNRGPIFYLRADAIP